jgi:hypothetical protein
MWAFVVPELNDLERLTMEESFIQNISNHEPTDSASHPDTEMLGYTRCGNLKTRTVEFHPRPSQDESSWATSKLSLKNIKLLSHESKVRLPNILRILKCFIN